MNKIAAKSLPQQKNKMKIATNNFVYIHAWTCVCLYCTLTKCQRFAFQNDCTGLDTHQQDMGVPISPHSHKHLVWSRSIPFISLIEEKYVIVFSFHFSDS